VNFSNVDLNLLWVLHVLLEEKSVVRAAKRLHVTPPAVSNALGRLRSLLGDPIFVRSGRGLVPTPRAVALAPRLARVMESLQVSVWGDAAFSPEATTRTFTVACSDADQISSVPRIAERFERAMPRARLRVVSIDQLEATDGLARGDIDVVFTPEQALGPDLHATDLYEDEAVLVVRRDHPRVRGRRLSREGFNALRHVDVWLALGRAGAGNRMAETFFEAHGLRRDVALVVPSFSAAVAVAASSDLAAGVPRRFGEWAAAALPLRILAIPAPPMRFCMRLAWHERTHADASCRFFRGLVLDALREPRRRSRSAKTSR